MPINIENDRPERFEQFILGGVFDTNLDEAIEYRKKWTKIFSDIELKKDCRMIQGLRGDSNNCKIVYVFDNDMRRDEFISFLNEKNIAYYEGYKVPEGSGVSAAKTVEGKIVELPIESREDKMTYLYKCVKSFFDDAGD